MQKLDWAKTEPMGPIMADKVGVRGQVLAAKSGPILLKVDPI